MHGERFLVRRVIRLRRIQNHVTYYQKRIPKNGILSVLLSVLFKALVIFVYGALILFWLMVAMFGLALLALAVSHW